MKTIDDLKFPEMDKPAMEFTLDADYKLPGKPVLRKGTKVKLWHTGMFAKVRLRELFGVFNDRFQLYPFVGDRGGLRCT